MIHREYWDIHPEWADFVRDYWVEGGRVQQVKDEVKKNIEILAPGGGFVFSTVHNVQADVTPQNFWAMWETLQEYGKY